METTEKKERKKMNKTKNKIVTITIAVFLMLSMTASTMLIPTSNAHTPVWQIPTYAYISVAPNPVGVGQYVSIYMWLTNFYYGASVANNYKFTNFKLVITPPSGSPITRTYAVISDPTSNQHDSFIPDQVGTYTLNFSYPGQTYSAAASATYAAYVNDTFLPSSASTTFVVQQDPVPPPSGGAPLPTAYWTRPIYGENSQWWTISSNWLGIGAPNYGGYTNAGADAMGGASNGEAMFPGDAIGPQTSHVMWTKPLQSGGVVGGGNYAIQAQTYFDGSAYIIRYNNPIIMDGMLYYTEPVGFSNTGYSSGGAGTGYGPTDCVNLRTGKLIWSKTTVPSLSQGFGISPDVQTANQHGVCPPLLVSPSTSGTNITWRVFDGDTGDWLSNVTNVPSFGSGRVMGPDGEYLNYVMANAGNATNPDWRLCQWNTTKLSLQSGNAVATTTIDASLQSRFDWNISIQWLNTMPLLPTINTTSPTGALIPPTPGTNPVHIVAAKYGDGILCYNGTLPSNGENQLFSFISWFPYTYFFVNLNASRGAVGSVLWWNTLNPPANNYTVVQGGVDWNTRIFLQSYKEATKWAAYDLDSGKQIWEAAPQAALDYYGSPSAGVLSGQIAYGKLYSMAMGGILYCYDDKTGHLLWTYGNGGEGNSTNSYLDWPYGNEPTFVQAIGNGVVYTITSEHTWVSPIYKGGLARAINATDGSEIWTISSVTIEFGSTSYAIADGFATWFNGYDNCIYTVGRGPSATTVTASPKVSSFGNNVIIEGTVTDISAGTKQDQQVADFPNGVSVASDANMKEWMGYVYQQQPQPTNFTGVPVQFYVLDSNGNYRQIGTTTTDISGSFSLTWTPDIPGNFTVYANFAGTNGYWPSDAETHFNIMETTATTAPVATIQAGLATTSDLMTYIVVGVIAVIIAIAIVGVLMIRKRS